MSKKIPLDRLREISKQRSIRSTTLQEWPVDERSSEDPGSLEAEWPIRSSVWL